MPGTRTGQQCVELGLGEHEAEVVDRSEGRLVVPKFDSTTRVLDSRRNGESVLAFTRRGRELPTFPGKRVQTMASPSYEDIVNVVVQIGEVGLDSGAPQGSPDTA